MFIKLTIYFLLKHFVLIPTIAHYVFIERHYLQLKTFGADAILAQYMFIWTYNFLLLETLHANTLHSTIQYTIQYNLHL